LSLDITRPLQYAFSVEAQALFIAWLTELEAKVRDGTLHPALVSHLSKYRSLMPSLALHFELADNGSQTTVSLAHAQQAASWCSYLESHAKRVYSLVISPPLRAAAELGHHLVEDGWKRQEGRFTVREVCVRGGVVWRLPTRFAERWTCLPTQIGFAFAIQRRATPRGEDLVRSTSSAHG
jgi:hypothetical protein